MGLLHKNVRIILGDKMTGAIRGLCGGGGFESSLLGWREDEENKM